ncbi:FGGY-family carbohydrate kinase [Thiomicrorhabdus lithotrophica]|uniref:FGGY-family carbohydrate kinase n=1 Tax=Thiomicrorhabdus lithotrophica TaxID=2949997 RepID=A0ABY8CAD1_9GAMM|nr:FGGY-family carbohydrate kinase [Thiomicrorhabdus lithotrophica]WEJ61531.1 FGGY-family carbohydrate kinase [Thiomicrorhabdus lithotrophica]
MNIISPSITPNIHNLSTSDTKIILGIDIGTSGVRGCIVKKKTCETSVTETIISEVAIEMPSATKGVDNSISQDASIWIHSVNQLLIGLAKNFKLDAITHLVLDATSSTVLLTDQEGSPLSKALMYNDAQSIDHATKISEQIEISKEFSGAQGASSTLAKVMTLLEQNKDISHPVISHQIDFINHYLCGAMNITDENNALKLGYNSIHQAWPSWVKSIIKAKNKNVELPKVVKPGSLLGTILPDIAKKFGFKNNLKVMSGTTDSIAGFLASGATKVGDAVSSLGSTLAIKVISEKPIFNNKYGLYSHKLGDFWLVGGASNSGGRVLLDFYTVGELKQLSSKISAEQIEQYLKTNPPAFYPLREKGERFPIADSHLKPIMPNKPTCHFSQVKNSETCLRQHTLFLLNLLLGITQIEKLAYSKLSELGVLDIKRIFTVGGGTKNQVWMQLRELQLNTPLSIAENPQAAYGVTKLIE